MRGIVKQIFSFILPVTVLILIPMYLEKDLSIKHVPAFLMGIFIICVGLTTMILTISLFIRIGKGTLAPWSPPNKLITNGIYRYVRNPMIMGVLTVLIGESIAIMSLKIAIWALVFFITNNVYFVIYEEPDLEKRFGKEYINYKKNVPRWIPRLNPFKI
jgi:protein-S-isoprenylcysteine O-methyltransferase Ste14